MLCPKCAAKKTKVIGTVSDTRVKRFRKCTKCSYTFCTIEAIEFDDYWREYAKITYEDSYKKQLR